MPWACTDLLKGLIDRTTDRSTNRSTECTIDLRRNVRHVQIFFDRSGQLFALAPHAHPTVFDHWLTAAPHRADGGWAKHEFGVPSGEQVKGVVNGRQQRNLNLGRMTLHPTDDAAQQRHGRIV